MSHRQMIDLQHMCIPPENKICLRLCRRQTHHDPVSKEKQGKSRDSDLNSAAEQSPATAGLPEQFCTVEIKSLVHAFTLSLQADCLIAEVSIPRLSYVCKQFFGLRRKVPDAAPGGKTHR